MPKITPNSWLQVIVFLALWAWVSSAYSLEPGFTLITRVEYQKELDFKPDQSPKFLDFWKTPSAPTEDAPIITLIKPVLTKVITSPIDIELLFKTKGPEIDLDTLKILYGFLKLDITDRIKEKAKISAYGLHAVGAELPAGSHRLRVEIKDKAGNTGWKDFTFEIE